MAQSERGIVARWSEAVARLLSRLTGRDVTAREAQWLIGLMLLGWIIRIVYVLATEGYTLAGDQREYHAIGQAAAAGNWFHTPFPYGEVHESVARPPGYMAWIGVLYTVLGVSITKALLVQTLIGPIAIALTWVLARRLFEPRVALVAAALAALYPNMWQWEGRLYSEALVLPLSLLVMILVLEQPVTAKRAAVVGAVTGLSMLVRPSQIFMFLFVLVAFWVATGVRRSVAMTAVCVGAAALVISPWTIRNYVVSDHFVPISIQDMAIAGTFNDDAANDEKFPYAWRPTNSRDMDVWGPGSRRLEDAELRDVLQSRALDYIEDNPFSVAEAFFWNGLSRTWDIRTPARVLDEVPFEGREEPVAAVGLGAYWILLAAAIAALWRLRRRTSLTLPILAGALGTSIVFTIAAGSRYRVPYEPVLVVMASTTLVLAYDRLRGRSGSQASAESPRPGAEPAT